MIPDEEVVTKSDELGVHTSNVQRDYVFGWLLAGLYHSSNPLARVFALKGGNAFRKAYLEHGRFSNDLDFSTSTELSKAQLVDGLAIACSYAQQQSGIEFDFDETRIAQHTLADDDASIYVARVYFRSFFGEEDVLLKAKLDVKEFDNVILPLQDRPLLHAYSDASTCQATLRVWKLEELLASKLNAMLHRQHSPDLFDLVYAVFFQRVFAVSRLEVVRTFLKKTIFDGDPPAARKLLVDLPLQAIKGFWQKYLVCPRASSVAFEDAEKTFRDLIPQLFDLLGPPAVPAFATPFRSSRLSYFPAAWRETIMEAGRLQRLLSVVYDGFERVVEPYALTYKRRKDGVAREYFYAWDRTGGRSGQVGIKSFVTEKVQRVGLLEDTFEPKYPIELFKTTIGYFTGPRFVSNRPTTTRSSYVPRGPYRVTCFICHKTFSRTKPGSTIGPHKNSYGGQCPGRRGHPS